MRLVLYQPEISQNVGTVLRTCACFDVHVDIIEPCGFVFEDKKFIRSAMDYINICSYNRFNSWECYNREYLMKNENLRLIATTPQSKNYHHKFEFKENDIILFGCESKGLPKNIIDIAKEKICIPMKENSRSLNLAISCGIFLSTFLQNTGGFDRLILGNKT